MPKHDYPESEAAKVCNGLSGLVKHLKKAIFIIFGHTCDNKTRFREKILSNATDQSSQFL